MTDAPETSERVLDAAVGAAAASDADRAVARLDPADMKALGVRAGDLILIEGTDATAARALPTRPDRRSPGRVDLDETQRANAGLGLGDRATLRAAPSRRATAVELTIESGARRIDPPLRRRIVAALQDTPVRAGDGLRIVLIGGRVLQARVTALTPSAEAAVIDADTNVTLAAAAPMEARAGAYADVGGLDAQIAAVREMIETPIERPELFERLGLNPPRGVLFTGPPGSGKTMLARAVADEAGLAFFQVNAPEIVSKHYGDSEQRLRDLFDRAAAKAPSVIFIDEIDAIAPKRDGMATDRQLERRVVAQLLTLMDGLSGRDGVVVMAATNLPDSLDPALRRPGRFDREIAFPPPDRAGRAQILAAHLRAAPLADDVDLDALAAATHGFVGADLAALAREAGMAALRRATNGVANAAIAPETVFVEARDFAVALGKVGPSVVRDVEIETPQVRWSDVGGADAAKAALIEAVIWPLRHADAFARLRLEPVKGVLLAGPPGTGKTHLARALAHEAGVNFIAVRGAQLLSRYLGDAERAVRDLFQKARLSAPSILFFDEIDALAPARAALGGGAEARVVATLLAEIDGVEELRGVFLLGATNRVDAIDPALRRPGRFDLTLDVGPPDAAVRRDILEIHTRGAPLAEDVDLDAVAENAVGLVGADLRAVAQEAARGALRRRLLETGAAAASGLDDVVVTAEDFRDALTAVAAARGAETGDRP